MLQGTIYNSKLNGVIMLEKVTFLQTGKTDLRMVNCGIEDCSPSFQWGPGIRDRYIIHVVISGSGSFKTKNDVYELTQGGGFLVSPDEVIEYSASKDSPWSYAWVGFDGLASKTILNQCNLSSSNPVFNLSNSDNFVLLIHNMLSCAQMKRGRDEMLLGLLYQFLSELIQVNGTDDLKTKESLQENYLHTCLDYISNNYSTRVTVNDLSSFVGLDRSYLYSLFMKYLHTSPKEFITLFRIKKADELLQTSLAINEIARSVGYEDSLLFSKIFRRYKGVSPTHYRKEHFKDKEMV